MRVGSLFSTSSPAFIACRFFDDGQSDWCEVRPHCYFYLHFSDSDVGHLFMCLLAVCMSSLGKGLFRSTCFFNLVVYFSDIELHELLVYFGD